MAAGLRQILALTFMSRSGEPRLLPKRTPMALAILAAVHSGETAASLCCLGEGQVRESLADGCRVMIPIALNSSNRVLQFCQRILARLRVAQARRYFASAEATRVRILAVVAGTDAIDLLYEIGHPAQDYVEQRVIMQALPRFPLKRWAKSLIRLVSGVDSNAQMLVVVGERT